MMRWLAEPKIFAGILFVLPMIFLGLITHAQDHSFDDLRREIDQKNEEIQKIEEEIKVHREKLLAKEQEAKTLQNEISKIDLTLRKFASDIRLTNTRIARTRLEVQELNEEIAGKGHAIQKSRKNLSGLLTSISRLDAEGVLTVIAKYESLTAFFDSLYFLLGIEKNIHARLQDLRILRQELEEAKIAAESKQRELAVLLTTLNHQQDLQEDQRKARTTLFVETRNQERRFQAILAEQEERRAALEEEISEIEEKIRITIDPTSLPQKGSGTLGWPLPGISLKSCWNGGDEAKNCVTQHFGRTSFAAAGGYRGAGHNGADFRADIGTPVFAAERGVVEGVGDTDLGCRRASYGRWVLIRHSNNLSTLYAHLSAIHVSAGKEVRRGEQVGLSGKTGYATGPHLHFSVFAAQAVEIRTIRSRVCSRNMTLPVSAVNGYLNPLDYL